MAIDIGQYRIEYHPPGEDGTPIVNQGWRVYKASYHRHRRGQPIQRKRRLPRWSLQEVFDTEKTAIAYVQEQTEQDSK